jgi:hypothetical protein
MKKPTPATDKVVAFLQAQRDDLARLDIDYSKVAVLDRLLSLEDTLEEAWANLLAVCPVGCPRSNWELWQHVVDMLVDVAIDCTPDKINAIRDDLRRISDLNKSIADQAKELAKSLRKRDELRVHGDITVPDDQTPLDLLTRAAELKDPRTGYLFARHIAPTLNDLRGQFDPKYWPTTASLFDAIIEAQCLSVPTVRDKLAAAALQVRQTSERDFMRALDLALSDLFRENCVGTEIRLSAKAYAALCNALLGLDGAIDSRGVIAYRADQRKRKKSSGDR